MEDYKLEKDQIVKLFQSVLSSVLHSQEMDSVLACQSLFDTLRHRLEGAVLGFFFFD